jgi:prephenate dehydrogenase
MTVTVVGVGLIGGSLALDLKAAGLARRVIGVDLNPRHAAEALRLGLVDEMMGLDAAVPAAQIVVLAIPVDQTVALLPRVLDLLGENGVVTDMGSTKRSICDAVNMHPRRDRYVASHPIAGTEHSGPSAALRGLFAGKLGILCDIDRSAPDAVATLRRMYATLGMRLQSMDAVDHDRHVAYVSHISHITSFVLATTVLEIEKNTSTIFDLAGSGFESTVRLAKSSPDMWAPIFGHNAGFVCEALDAYIRNITAFRNMIADGQSAALLDTMSAANEIRRVLAGITSTSTQSHHPHHNPGHPTAP